MHHVASPGTMFFMPRVLHRGSCALTAGVQAHLIRPSLYHLTAGSNQTAKLEQVPPVSKSFSLGAPTSMLQYGATSQARTHIK